MAEFPSLLWQNNTPLYKYMHYIFFIHSSIDGHLGCYHVLVIENNATMNLAMTLSF